MIFKILRRSVSAVIVLLLTVAAGFAQVPSSQHVILVINENSSYGDVMANMPWLVSQGMANGYATNYKSDNGGSLLDYLWLASGSCHSSANCTLPPGTHNFNCNGNDCYYPGTNITDPITDDNIFRELNTAGISWKVYAQSYALAGATPTTPDNKNGTSYYRRHNGAVWFSDILNNVDGSANKIVDFSHLATDLANGALPRYIIIVPDGNHDGHDCPVGMSNCTGEQKLAAADSFLSSALEPILNTPDFQPGGDGLLFVTFDECGGGTNAGCGAAVYTAVIGPKVLPHTVSNIAYKHENTLRTILDALNITSYPGAAATASDISDFFVTAGSKPEVTIRFPTSGTLVGSPVSLQAWALPTRSQTVSGWYVYVDGAAAYHTGAVSSINASLTMSNGQHSVIVRAWDTSGAFADQRLTLTVNALKPAVTVVAPVNHAKVGSPVNVVASASPTAGHPVSGWWIYMDGAGVYNAGAIGAINANIDMPFGAHTVVIRAWDSSGAYGDQTLSVEVSAVTVNVSTPTNGASVNSPVNIQASAASAHTITGWHVYVDSVDSFAQTNGKFINANLAMTPGKHGVLVRAWDSTGAFGDQTINITVP